MDGAMMSDTVGSFSTGSLFYSGDEDSPTLGIAIGRNQAIFLNMGPWVDFPDSVSIRTLPTEGMFLLKDEYLGEFLKGSPWYDPGDARYIWIMLEVVRMMAERTERLLAN